MAGGPTKPEPAAMIRRTLNCLREATAPRVVCQLKRASHLRRRAFGLPRSAFDGFNGPVCGGLNVYKKDPTAPSRICFRGRRDYDGLLGSARIPSNALVASGPQSPRNAS